MSRAAAKTRGTAAPDHGQGQRGRQRPAGLLGPAGDGAGGEGERGVPPYRADLPEELEAPVERGQTLGKAAVYQGEALLEEYEVRAAADAPRMTVRDAIGLLWQSLTGAA